ncbi:hypothetical protein MYP_854 [Sporocytophaga myxococcoides]|uniref:Uncharacterized protein n=2 Tax=Sporocytophaga myxococcoides TaxID=153721 RepID=A0A098LB01_9BACT|nr:hypothetical protein MYP_854 [Sporocytophaga myxococcoides]
MESEGMETQVITSTVANLNEPSFLTTNKKDYLQELKLSVNPNPASDFISLDFKDLSSDENKLRITAQDRAAVLETNLCASIGESHSIDVSRLKNGCISWRLLHQEEKLLKKS